MGDSEDSWDLRIHRNLLYVMKTSKGTGLRELSRVQLMSPDLSRAESILVDSDRTIQGWTLYGERLITSTTENLSTVLRTYSLDGKAIGKIALPESCTATILGGNDDGVFVSTESYNYPREVHYFSYSTDTLVPFDRTSEPVSFIDVKRVQYSSVDGTSVPLTLLGRPDVLERGHAPALLTAYGAAGTSLTPQYSYLAACLIELGAVFAIAHVRGGGEKGASWETAGKRNNRPNTHNDFIAAAEYLFNNDIAEPNRLAIAGGSNSGLLVATAMTQRPDLFRAVLCIAPFTDMLRYHLFDNTQFYVDLFGFADDPHDFNTLLSYSPYHNMDTRCDPMHALKFVARLRQAASLGSMEGRPIVLDWNPDRGHFATLPLSTRINSLVDRLAFILHQLSLEAR
jgi:prolyl oligopeptidase